MGDKTTRGYASVENWIIRQCEGLTEHELVVFLVLRSYAGNKPFCSPSRETIAANARVSVRTADKALRGLAAKGFITWRQQSEAGRKKSSAYTIRVDLKDCINGTLGPGLDVQELHIKKIILIKLIILTSALLTELQTLRRMNALTLIKSATL